MKRLITVVSTALLIAGCSSPAERESERLFKEQVEQQDINEIQKNLPKGCSISYLGEVRIADRSDYYPPAIFMVRCDDSKVTTTNSSRLAQRGKQTVVLNGVTYAIEPVEKAR